MRTTLVYLCLFIGIHCAQSQEPTEIILGTKHTLHSDTLNEARTYWVSLPESYNEEAAYRTYPLLIVLDGPSHFRSITGMVNYLSAGYNGNLQVPEMIVVALENVNRRRDFTPDKIITTRENDSGGGEAFLYFLENELIPALDQNYRTEPYRILFGHSLGGLLATHAYMKEETLFNAFIAVDPSMGTWDAETMDQKLKNVTERSFDRYLYIATANWGKRNLRNRDRHVRLYEALNNRCEGAFPAKLEYFEDENHGSVPPLAFYHGINSIFEGYGIYYRDIDQVSVFNQHFQALSDRLSWKVRPPEALVNRIGNTLLRSSDENDRLEALAFFRLNTENYPDSYSAYERLGDAYATLQETKQAIKSYEHALALNPNNGNLQMKIDNLKTGAKKSPLNE